MGTDVFLKYHIRKHKVSSRYRHCKNHCHDAREQVWQRVLAQLPQRQRAASRTPYALVFLLRAGGSVVSWGGYGRQKTGRGNAGMRLRIAARAVASPSAIAAFIPWITMISLRLLASSFRSCSASRLVIPPQNFGW